ncbi:MAG: phage late control D family protein, partial [Deltaproteobacteria bacterium]|nr:phage late control D family protein [Deltaproteobacteria bacterium]
MPRNVTTQVLSSDLDCTGVEVIRLAGREGMSKLFRFELELVATSSKLPPGPNMVGAQLILVFTTDKGLERVVAGIVCEVEDDFDPSAGARYLKVSLVPRAHRLSLVTLYESSAGRLREVLLEKLGACDVAVELRISENYENFIEEFLTQYGESDLAFLDRRCQRLGVNYFFKTTRDQGDVMVFTDTGVFDDRTKDLVVPFRSSGEQTDVHALTVKSRMVASNYIVFDYNHRTPLTQIMGTTKLDAGHGGGVLEYGANMRTPEGARWLSKVRAEEAESRRIEFHGKSDRPELYPGLMFTVEAHPTLGSVELL